MLPHALEIICEKVSEEMDQVQKSEKLPGLDAITPEFIKAWSVAGHKDQAPYLSQILLAAAEMASAKEKNKKKSPIATSNIIMKQLCFQCSHNSLGFPTQFGLFLWATGCARQTIEALHWCGLSVSYTSVLNTIELLANHCLQLAVDVGSGTHIFCYDNVNISTSIFVEQRGALGPAKVTSGTFGVIYKVRNGKPENMMLAPIMEHLKKSKGLDFNCDVQLTWRQLEFVQYQLSIVIVHVLTKYSKHFKSYAKHPSLQHKAQCAMPEGYITEQYPIQATTIEEATVQGNLLFHEDVYLTQLKRHPDDLSKYVFQLGFGLFHLCLNLIWLLLHVHRGTLEQTGSLVFFFALLEKTRLGGEHPDYHSLLSSLTQIRDGLLLNAWHTECGNLKQYSESKPSPEVLLSVAQGILTKYATAVPKPDIKEMDSSEEEGDS
ncbi:uncharacterized protein LACBIDRAFT_307660 [Laccaria bicolor S238N-H82]|uniref:Predicted protein n=1 Tax=Laccaria bicolor (strain S238N-H82 / ATCC MYA-4686) TaxID=486041 RepID=B0DQP4_LACBS|nr:uncharacterized protein LACBIDRAFT_307660 [Laccaria bicolor S238N-H82]EDR03150.1 predicted protein [Laccaria bicolor S238N-H82]|eukprot:XP_001886291.1 predicted protein [Laccaria bicolor S238N-H82]